MLTTKFFSDLHTHSKYSDGRATVPEMIKAATERGLEQVAITDHGPRNIAVGVSRAETFLQIKKEAELVRKDFPGIRVMVGAEADVLTMKGDIDVPEDIYQQLDLLLIGLHPFVLPGDLATGVEMVLGNQFYKLSGSLKQRVKNVNTKALTEAVLRHKPFAVTHPGLGMPVDVQEIARACATAETAYEINSGHDFQTVVELTTAAREGVKFVINSDAHFPESVGRLEVGLALVEQARIPVEQVLNLRS